MQSIDTLRAFAFANYNGGGHIQFESYTDFDYMVLLTDCGGDIQAAKALISAEWEWNNGEIHNGVWSI